MVTMSIVAGMGPAITTMAIAPAEAAKRAENLGVAESAAVVFAAKYEGGVEAPPEATDNCTSEARENTKNAFSVTCTYGTGKYVQSVTRAFRLAVPDKGLEGTGVEEGRQFQFEKPTRYSGHQCPIHDPWGVYGYNDQYYTALNGACMPQDAWNQTNYQFSDPDAWLYDINNIKGWGDHPDY